MDKPKRLFTYSEDQVNAMLQVLGDLPAKNVITVINSLYKPVKIENINEAKQEEKAE